MEVGNRFILSVYLMLGIAVIAGVIMLLDVEKCHRLARTIDHADAAPGAEWNDFNSPVFHPTLDEAKVHRVTVVPTTERAAALCHIGHLLPDRLRSSEFAGHLLPLHGWRSANAFLVRRRVGLVWAQYTDCGCEVMLELRKVDGSPLLSPQGDKAAAIKALARTWLPDNLQPVTFHFGRHGDCLATWTTADMIDRTGVRLDTCFCACNDRGVQLAFPAHTLKFRTLSFPPYTFGSTSTHLVK